MKGVRGLDILILGGGVKIMGNSPEYQGRGGARKF